MSSTTGKEFGRELKAARSLRGWKQSELAEQLQITQATVSEWERGTRSPAKSRLRTLAKILDRPEWLPGGEQPSQPAIEATADNFEGTKLGDSADFATWCHAAWTVIALEGGPMSASGPAYFAAWAGEIEVPQDVEPSYDTLLHAALLFRTFRKAG